MGRRAPLVPSALEQAAHKFLHYRDVKSDATREWEAARDQIKGWATLKNAVGNFVNGEEDENGNRILPWTINGKRLVAQRKMPAPETDLDKVEKLLREKGGQGLYDQVFKRKVIREFDENALFVLHQLGYFTDEEMDALEVQGEPSYSLVVEDA